MELYVDSGIAPGLMPSVVERAGVAADDLLKRRARVSEAAGRAGEAPSLTGCVMVV
jgi:hypothetical protein